MTNYLDRRPIHDSIPYPFSQTEYIIKLTFSWYQTYSIYGASPEEDSLCLRSIPCPKPGKQLIGSYSRFDLVGGFCAPSSSRDGGHLFAVLQTHIVSYCIRNFAHANGYFLQVAFLLPVASNCIFHFIYTFH